LGAFAGYGALFMAANFWLFARSETALGVRARALLLCASLPLASLLSELTLIHRLSDLSLDRVLLASDGLLGFQPGFAVALAVRAIPGGLRIIQAVYLSVPFAMACAYVANRPASRSDLLKGLIVAGVLARPLYDLLPAAGPGFAFRDVFPGQVPTSGPDWMDPIALPHAAFNCVPSLHLSWALLIFWSLRGKSVLAAVVSGCFLALTAVATLALGEHYLIDLVLSVPFALAVRALCASPLARPWGWSRIRALVLGSLLSVGWMVCVRTGLIFHFDGQLVWTVMVFTSLVSAYIEARFSSGLAPLRRIQVQARAASAS
jgi:hypothetical protein